MENTVELKGFESRRRDWSWGEIKKSESIRVCC